MEAAAGQRCGRARECATPPELPRRPGTFGWSLRARAVLRCDLRGDVHGERLRDENGRLALQPRVQRRLDALARERDGRLERVDHGPRAAPRTPHPAAARRCSPPARRGRGPGRPRQGASRDLLSPDWKRRTRERLAEEPRGDWHGVGDREHGEEGDPTVVERHPPPPYLEPSRPEVHDLPHQAPQPEGS